MIVYVVDGNVRSARFTKKRLFGAVIGVLQTRLRMIERGTTSSDRAIQTAHRVPAQKQANAGKRQQ
jgi:hypothetical protein